MREQAAEGLQHATEAGEEITSLGGRVSLGIGELAGTHHESIDDILRELIVHERKGIELYQQLLRLSEGCSVSQRSLRERKSAKMRCMSPRSRRCFAAAEMHEGKVRVDPRPYAAGRSRRGGAGSGQPDAVQARGGATHGSARRLAARSLGKIASRCLPASTVISTSRFFLSVY